MKTILFNTDTNQPVNGVIRNGYYLVDGVRPFLPTNIVELEVIEPTKEQLEQNGLWVRNENRYEYINRNEPIVPQHEEETTGFWSNLLNIFK